METREDDRDQRRFEQKRLLLQLVQTIVVVVGVVFALIELRNAVNEHQKERYEITANMLSRFAEPALIDGANALLEAGGVEVTRENYISALIRLTPLHEHFITWAACLAEDICLKGETRDLFCRRLLVYESTMESFMQKFKEPYDKKFRIMSYLGQFENCETDHAYWVDRIFP